MNRAILSATQDCDLAGLQEISSWILSGPDQNLNPNVKEFSSLIAQMYKLNA